MDPSRRAGMAVLVLSCVGNILLAQEQDNRRGRDNRPETRLLNNIFRTPRRVTATEQQKAKLKALREKHGSQLATKLLEIQKKVNAVYTREQSATRRRVTLEARKAGKGFAEATKAVEAAVKLSDKQKEQIAQLQQERQKLLTPIRREIDAVFARRGGSSGRIVATHGDVKYGPHERNVLDFWQAKSDRPTPVLVSIHGGGFRNGNKSVNGTLLRQCLDSKISVAAISYRLSQHAIAPACFTDSARAIQFIRSKAKPWNLDPKRFAATGGSAGAGISLWLGFHDDMADPENNDPVLRQSTRLTCMFVNNGQTSYDPRFIRDLFPGKDTFQHSALAQLFDVNLANLNELPQEKYRLFEEVSAINHLTKDDPPAILSYNRSIDTEVTDQSIGIHHAKFGQVLKERMDELGIFCAVYAVGKSLDGGPRLSTIDFLKQQFRLEN